MPNHPPAPDWVFQPGMTGCGVAISSDLTLMSFLQVERHVVVELRVHVDRLGLHEHGAGNSCLIKTAFLSAIPSEISLC